MSELPVLDESMLAKLRALFDEEFEQQMLKLFLEHVPGKIAAAKSAGERGDLESVKAAAHFIKSSANKVGAATLWQLAGRVEELADQGNAEAIRLLGELEQAHEQVCPLIRQHIKS